MFRALWQSYSNTVRLVARSSGYDAKLPQRIRQLVQEMDPEMTLYGEETLEQHIDLPLPAVAPGGGVVCGVRSDHAGAGGDRNLCGDGVRGLAPDEGNWDPDGDWRQSVRGSAWLIGRRHCGWWADPALVGSVLSLLVAGRLSPLLLGVNPWDPTVQLLRFAIDRGDRLCGLLAAGASGGDARSEPVAAAGLRRVIPGLRRRPRVAGVEDSRRWSGISSWGLC